jgi:hypothetical protein
LTPFDPQSAADLAADREKTKASLLSFDNQAVDGLLLLMSDMSPLITAVNTADVFDNEACQQILYDCLAHREKIIAWYSREEKNIGGRPSVCAPGELFSTRLLPATHLFGPSYDFSSLDNARIHTTFWAALSILQALIGQIYVYAYATAAGDILTNKEYLLSEYYADEISRALPYCLQDSMKAWGISITIFGVGQIAKVYMELRRKEKFMWSQQVLRVMGELGPDLPLRMGELLQYGWILGEKSDRDALQVASPVSSTSKSTGSSASTASTTPPGMDNAHVTEMADASCVELPER